MTGRGEWNEGGKVRKEERKGGNGKEEIKDKFWNKKLEMMAGYKRGGKEKCAEKARET